MPSLGQRLSLGFLAGALSVFTFHQWMWGILYAVGYMHAAPYPTYLVAPFGVPRIIDLAFWGGVWGAGFGLVQPFFSGRLPTLSGGLVLGTLAALVGIFIVPVIKGGIAPAGVPAKVFVIAFLINGCWGIGTALYLGLALRWLGPRRRFARSAKGGLS